jgi:ATP adenylyltransferase
MGLYCMENYRTAEQLATMQELEAAGLCLFCPDGLQQQPRQRILWETAHWTVTPNEFPYKGTALHLLVVPHEHATDLLDLSSASQLDFWNALAMIRERFDLNYYGLGVRNGDCQFTGATIAHVHAHVIVGDTGSADEVPVRMRFSSRPLMQGRPGR